jgi:hypothetical protein
LLGTFSGRCGQRTVGKLVTGFEGLRWMVGSPRARGAVLLGATALAALLPACGGGADPGGTSCGTIQPCGGDVQGTWVPAGSCFNQARFVQTLSTMFGLSCPVGSPITLTHTTSDRSISSAFAAGSYSGTSSFSGEIDIDVPAACLAVGGVCSDLDAVFAGLVGPAGGIEAVLCSGSTACACTIALGGSSSDTGTYSTSGSILETVRSDGVVNQTDYCVSGSELHFISLAPTSGTSSDPPVIASDTVLRRMP